MESVLIIHHDTAPPKGCSRWSLQCRKAEICLCQLCAEVNAPHPTPKHHEIGCVFLNGGDCTCGKEG